MKAFNIIATVATTVVCMMATSANAQYYVHRPYYGPAPVRYYHVPVVRSPRVVWAPRYARPYYVRTINPRARVIYVGNTPYYSYSGVYYRYVPNYGYEEVVAPKEDILTAVPAGAKEVKVDDATYYVANNVWYMPVENGFMIVENPLNSPTRPVEDVAVEPVDSAADSVAVVKATTPVYVNDEANNAPEVTVTETAPAKVEVQKPVDSQSNAPIIVNVTPAPTEIVINNNTTNVTPAPEPAKEEEPKSTEEVDDVYK